MGKPKLYTIVEVKSSSLTCPKPDIPKYGRHVLADTRGRQNHFKHASKLKYVIRKEYTNAEPCSKHTTN